MTQYFKPHPYVMRLRAELRASKPGWPALEAGDRLTRAFIAAASRADLFQIKAARLALTRGSGRAVHALAQTLLEDRRQIAQRLQSTLRVAGLEGNDSLISYQLNAEDEGILNHLSDMEEKDFGPGFVRQQTAAHKETVSIFRFYGVCGEQHAVRAFARITLSSLEKRLEEVQKLS